MRRVNQNITGAFAEMPDVNIMISDIVPLSKMVMDEYKKQTYKKVYIAYTHFSSALLQKPIIKQLLPIYKREVAEAIENLAVKPPNGGLTAKNLEEIKKSKEIIQNSGLPYEFRTTAVKGKHTKEIFEEIGEWLKGAEAYFIQNFRNKKTLAEEYKKKEGFSEKELAEFKLLMEKYVKNCGIRNR